MRDPAESWKSWRRSWEMGFERLSTSERQEMHCFHHTRFISVVTFWLYAVVLGSTIRARLVVGYGVFTP